MAAQKTLERVISKAGLGSRTQARTWIHARRVKVNGKVVENPDHWIDFDRDKVEFDGKPLEVSEKIYLLLHKPVGCVTALRDSQHAVAYDYLEGAALRDELRAVGRLDLDTSGLLLWTTEGHWLQRFTHPKWKVPRTYQAALAQPFVPPPPGFTLDDGHQPNIIEMRELDGGSLHPGLARPDDARLYAAITITGGAYHEVRRIFAALGSHVAALCRVSFGNLVLPDDLPPGEYRPFRPEDVIGE